MATSEERQTRSMYLGQRRFRVTLPTSMWSIIDELARSRDREWSDVVRDAIRSERRTSALDIGQHVLGTVWGYLLFAKDEADRLKTELDRRAREHSETTAQSNAVIGELEAGIARRDDEITRLKGEIESLRSPPGLIIDEEVFRLPDTVKGPDDLVEALGQDHTRFCL